MSGILGVLRLDGAPVPPDQLRAMARVLRRRGPEGESFWSAAQVGLGHTLLATTPEAEKEALPWKHGPSGCVITGDLRIDNRSELIPALGLRDRGANVGDGELVLRAYLAWGQACLTRLLGDFAFAIWDPRERRLFAARDPFAMRPFCYHHQPGKLFAFASSPRAILTVPEVPHRIHEPRIADFLVEELEGYDLTSTFFEEIHRLPPAHRLSVSEAGLRIERYDRLEPGPELRLGSVEEYAEAFLEVFQASVRARLRGAPRVGSMLSGGMDSGSIVAVASEILRESGRGPLPTFSGVAPDPAECVETRTIEAALAMDGLRPTRVRQDQFVEALPELSELIWQVEEPFDGHMTLILALYLAARREGLKVLLDGAAGDVVMSEGSYLARLLRRGRWRTAWKEAQGQYAFWGPPWTPARMLLRGARAGLLPLAVRRIGRSLLQSTRGASRVREAMRASGMHPDLARRTGFAERYRTYRTRHQPTRLSPGLGRERAASIMHANLVVGRERYERVAALASMEARDPFLDRRVVDFMVSLPVEAHVTGRGYKGLLRESMKQTLPESVRMRPGKEHLGWGFTASFLTSESREQRPPPPLGALASRRWLDSGVVDDMERLYVSGEALVRSRTFLNGVRLAAWQHDHDKNSERGRSE